MKRPVFGIEERVGINMFWGKCIMCGVEIINWHKVKYCAGCLIKAHKIKGDRFAKKKRVKECICIQCGKRFIKYLFPSSVSRGKFCSNRCKGLYYRVGEESTNKIRDRYKHKGLNKKVFIRDNYTCQECGFSAPLLGGGILHAHHIKPISTHPTEAENISNMITLCENCHAKKHQHSRSGAICKRQGGIN